MKYFVRPSHLRPAIVLLFLFSGLLFCGPFAAWSQPAPGWNWIWAPGKASTPDTVYFRLRFHLPAKFSMGRLLITADDNYRAFLNENKAPAAQGSDWTTVQEFDVTKFLKPGDNLLAVQAQNTGGSAGLIFKLIVTLPGGKTQTVFSDSKVKVNRRPPPGAWSLLSSDDKNWPPAQEIAPANDGPWGKLRSVLLPDPSRLVRVWDIHAAGKPEDDPYTAPRTQGDRMLLVSNVAGPSDMQILRSAGFTLFQTDSNHLSTEEKARNVWDWSLPEAARASVKSLGLDWCYFPHEAFPPPWYRQAVPFTRVQCLEDKLPIEAFSPWDPTWPDFIDRGYKALSEAFGPKKENGIPRSARISALCVGVYGDYGEAGFFIGARTAVPGQKEDWEARFHNLHNHIGWWCEDPAARADFRAAMLKKYVDLEHLNAFWHRAYKTPAEIDYPAMVRTPTGLTWDGRGDGRQEWLDFVEWYQSGISRAITLNLDAARKYFPDTLRMLPAGLGDENPRGGNDNSLIPKLAAQHQAEVRSTHGAFYPFAINAVTMLGRLGSASRFYQVPFWTEPQDVLTENQEVQRLFEDLSQGAKGHFDWAGNAVTNRDVYYRYGSLMHVEKPIVDVAMFYPAAAQRVRPDQGYPPLFTQACATMRDLANFDIVDDRMVLDGCLANYRVLALWEGTVTDQPTLDKIRQWVEEGGVLVAYDFGKVTTFDGDPTWFNDMFGYVQELEPATIAERYAGVLPTQYRIQVGETSASDYLSDDGWDRADMSSADNPLSHRWTNKAQASLRLPVNPDRQYTLVIRATVPQEAAALKRSVLVNGREVGQLGSPGDVTYRFLIPEGLLTTGNTKQPLATLTIQSELFQPAKLIPGSKDERMLGVWVQSVQLVEEGIGELADALPPPGSMRRELDLRQLNGSWSRLKGKGLTIYFPANKKLLKGYFEVLRRAIYHLSEIDPMGGRRDAMPIDDAPDGVYSTLFADKILYYNPLDTKVTKKVTIPARTFAAWKGEVATPKENSWTLSLEPHSLKAIYLKPEPQELPFDCEEFLDLGGAKVLSDPNCRPGSGPSCVLLTKGASISTRFLIEVPGRYTIYTRCLRGARMEAVDVLIDGQPIKGPDTRSGQTILSGEVNLAHGAHTLTLRARAADVRADFVTLTNDPTIAGYDFPLRFTPIE